MIGQVLNPSSPDMKLHQSGWSVILLANFSVYLMMSLMQRHKLMGSGLENLEIQYNEAMPTACPDCMLLHRPQGLCLQ